MNQATGSPRGPFQPCEHDHDTPEAQLVCIANTSAEGNADLSDPCVSLIGNMTDIANMIGSALDLIGALEALAEREFAEAQASDSDAKDPRQSAEAFHRASQRERTHG